MRAVEIFDRWWIDAVILPLKHDARNGNGRLVGQTRLERVVGRIGTIVGGTLIGRLGMEDQVAAFVRTVPVLSEAAIMTPGDRLAYARDQVVEIVHRV